MAPTIDPTGTQATSGAAFRGWWIVAVGLIAQAITIGLTIIPFGFFISPLTQEFDASVAEIQLGLAIFFVAVPLVGGLVGRLLDTRSIRGVMTGGALIMAASFCAMSFASSLWQLAVLFGLGAAAGMSMSGPLPATTVIAKWFDRKRGIAVGIASTGPLVGGVLLTPLAGWLLESVGWRPTLLVFGGISALLAPLAFVVVRNSPLDVGQEVDGGADAESAPSAGAGDPELSTAEILKDRNFWALALSSGIVFGLGGGWGANSPRFAEDLGYSAQHMATLIGASSLAGVLATLMFGAMADRVGNRALFWVCIAGQGGALLVLGTEPGELVFTTAIILYGFTGGGLLPVYASFVGKLFGAASFGNAMGLAGLVMLPFGAAAPVVAGAVRDNTGSYVPALFGFSFAFALSAALLILIRTPRADIPAYAEAAKEPA